MENKKKRINFLFLFPSQILIFETGSGPVGLRCMFWEHEAACSNHAYPTNGPLAQ